MYVHTRRVFAFCFCVSGLRRDYAQVDGVREGVEGEARGHRHGPRGIVQKQQTLLSFEKSSTGSALLVLGSWGGDFSVHVWPQELTAGRCSWLFRSMHRSAANVVQRS